MTIITKRVSGAITEGTTRRVETTGAVPSSVGTDTWGGTWGNPSVWGRTWLSGSLAVAQSPAVDTTKRVPSGATANITKRVTGI